MVNLASIAGRIWGRIRDPKKGSGDEAFLAAYASRDGLAAKSHSTTTQYRQLRKLH